MSPPSYLLVQITGSFKRPLPRVYGDDRKMSLGFCLLFWAARRVQSSGISAAPSVAVGIPPAARMSIRRGHGVAAGFVKTAGCFKSVVLRENDGLSRTVYALHCFHGDAPNDGPTRHPGGIEHVE